MKRLCKLHTTKRQCNIKYCNNLKKQKYSRNKQCNTNHCDKVKEQKKMHKCFKILHKIHNTGLCKLRATKK